MRIAVIDDSFRETQGLADGRHYVDRQGHKIQKAVRSTKVYEGKQVEIAVKRAKRWLRRGPEKSVLNPPRQIQYALAVFSKADPKGYAEAAEAAHAKEKKT